MTSGRPERLAFVTGTGTEVGKTWWAAATLARLRSAGVLVAARKPAQSGSGEGPTDADVLAAASGERRDAVCPAHRSYAIPWAPPMAAAKLGLPPYTVADVVAELEWPAGTQFGLVEGVGGPRSPIAVDGDNVDLARALDPDVIVIVADAGIGTINAVRLAAAPFDDRSRDGGRLVVALNRFDGGELHSLNRGWLVEREGFDVVTAPAQLAERLEP